MTSPTAGDAGEVLEATAAQVQDTIDRLTPEYTLTRKPTRGSFWHELREEVRGAYRAQARGHGSRSGRAIIMAGAPGAGKSQAVATARKALGPQRSKQVGVDESGYTTIDADDIKQLLLGNPVDGLDVNPDLLERARAHWDGLIAEQAPDPLPDGRPISRGELAALVHHLSTDTADLARGDLLVTRRTEHGSTRIDHIGRDGTARAYFAPRQWIAATENPTISTAQKQQFTPADTLRKINAGTQQATRSTPRPRGPEPPGHDHGIGL